MLIGESGQFIGQPLLLGVLELKCKLDKMQDWAPNNLFNL